MCVCIYVCMFINILTYNREHRDTVNTNSDQLRVIQ